MPGFGSNEIQVKVTPNRRTHVVFDMDDKVLTEPAFSIERICGEIARTTAAQLSNVSLVPDLGWSLRPHSERVSYLTERTELGSHVLDIGSGLFAATGFTSKKGYRAPSNTEMPDVATGASANLLTAGLPMIQKDVSGGDTWASALDADQSAFPSPATDEDTLVMDRAIVSDESDSPDKSIIFVFYCPGALQHNANKIATLYFTANPGLDENGTGDGSYAVAFRGDGRATLYERKFGFDTWIERFTFRYTTGNQPGQVFHTVVIQKRSCFSALTGPGGAITFRLGHTDGQSFFSYVSDIMRVLEGGNKLASVTYRIPRIRKFVFTIFERPLRVDIRRDLRCSVSLAWDRFPTEGELRDDPFSMEFFPTDQEDIALTWSRCQPEGCTLTMRLYRSDTDAELVQVREGASGKYRIYQCPEGVNSFYAKAFFTGDGSKSAILKAYKCFRNPVAQTLSVGEKEFANLRKISITGQERDPSHESADVSIANILADASILTTRGSIGTRIETEWGDSFSDPPNRCVLFRGYTVRANAQKKGSQNLPYAPDWKHFEVSLTGCWQRLAENVSEVRQAFWDYELDLPYKVTDAVRDMLGWCGFDTDIPDLEVRLFSQDTNSKAFMEPLTPLGDAIAKMVDEYLGHFLYFDANAGTYGKWKLIAPSVGPTYSNKAEFVYGSEASAGAPVMSLTSYSQSTPTAPIVKGSMYSWVKPPEANLIVVSTIGALTSQGTPRRMTSVLVNPFSYDFLNTGGLDTNHPDYLGRVVKMFVMNPALAGGAKSEEDIERAVNWTARRIYDVAAHAIKMVTFQAPLVLIEHEDDSNKRRPLRYYDPVLVNGEQFLIRNVNPAYAKDHVQMAQYEVEAPRI